MSTRGFDSALGCLEVMLLPLSKPPSETPGIYFNSQRKRYGIIAVVTTDHEGAFTSCEVRWVGGLTQLEALNHSLLWRERRKLFNSGEYVLASTGERLSIA
jgi:hypothetical protein